MNQSIKESDFIFYHGEDGKVHAQVILGDETVWITQLSLAEIFGIDRTGISRHINNILAEQELDEKSNVQFLHVANSDKPVGFYSLDMIIAVGYRVNSYKATKFRQWATRILKEYLTKGFVLDDERLKQGNRLFGKDYFKELLERIREIRTSERMFYEKITDLYATSVDYDKNDPNTHKFFAKVQSKLEYAIVGQTPAEIVKSRADAKMPNMGLTTWKNVNRDGKILKSDTTIAKNYLKKEELTALNLIVSSFLDHAEIIVSKNKLMKMQDWATRLDKFLDFNEYKVLKNAGKVSKELADESAENEFSKFKLIQDKNFKSDFNKTIEGIKAGNIPSAIEEAEQPLNEGLSEFNQNLTVALNYQSEQKKERKNRTPQSKTKECPICGKESDIKAEYCDGNVEADGEVVPCPHIYNT